MKHSSSSILLLLFSVAALFALPVITAAKSPHDEYEVKAIILYKFFPFIEWPESKSPENRGKLNICVIGKSDFGKKALILEKQSTQKLKIRILNEITFSKVPSCHIVYISKSEEKNLDAVLKRIHSIGSPVLTVSDINGFISRGGVIGLFINRHNKIKFEVNLKSADLMNIRVNAQMLEVAERVIGK